MIEAAELRSLPNSDVLGELLHSLCQPLTTLRCSLELSLDEFNERQCGPVSVALEQADHAIEAVQLIRQYLELERGMGPIRSVALTPAVHTVLKQLSVVAEAYRVPLLALGTASAALAGDEFWLHWALRYLIGSLIETQPPGHAVMVLLEDRPFPSTLSVHSVSCAQSASGHTHRRDVPSHLRRAKLAIAQRVFESAGATVDLFYGEQSGFTVHIPHTKPLLHRMSA